MPPRAKTILIWIAVITVLYTVVRSPERAADTARAGWDFVYSSFAGFAQFLSNLAA